MTSEIAESRTVAEQTVAGQRVGATAAFRFGSWDDIERRRPVGHIADRRRLSPRAVRAVRAVRRDRVARAGVSTATVGALRQAAHHPDGR
ncbi:hypothetical protein AB0M87_16195 [Streptomyces sp. NPDC051320]|uniref:hypothetical protein n=1 Tax=Streptomyces sp. NPDC051320 TaxID=3154644 RepID=UPI003425AD82